MLIASKCVQQIKLSEIVVYHCIQARKIRIYVSKTQTDKWNMVSHKGITSDSCS